ncbi:MAG: phosphopantetheine-binding protein [Planctomycetota bacterium]
MDDILPRIKAMLVERLMLPVTPESIGDDVDLREAFDLDSVRLFELVIGTEEVFGVSFEDDAFSMESFATVRKIAECIRGKQG